MKKWRDHLVDWLDGLSFEAGLMLLAAFVVGLIALVAIVTREAFDAGRQDRAQTIQSLRGPLWPSL